MTNIHLSSCLENVSIWSFSLAIALLLLWTFAGFLNFIHPSKRAYSKIGRMMKRMHDKIQRLIAVAVFGYLVSAELNMFTMQSKRVNSSPILPGTMSILITKLICKRLIESLRYNNSKTIFSSTLIMYTAQERATSNAGGAMI